MKNKIPNIDQKSIQEIVIFLLIFGNAVFLKEFATLKIEPFFYINEALLIILSLTLLKKNLNLIKYFLLLLPLPLYSLIANKYTLNLILQDYAFLLSRCDLCSFV